MSFYDRYLAPGDLRARQAALTPRVQHKGTQTDPPPPAAAQINPSATLAAVERIDPERRLRRQNALFFGGLGFTMLSLFITRRSLLRKRLPWPSQFTPSNAPVAKVEGGFDAAEALGLATLNTVSVFMVGLGAAAIWWDVADLEDLRDHVRSGVGYDVYGGDASSETDKELEAWVTEVMTRKGGMGDNIKEEMVQKLLEIEGREKETTQGQNVVQGEK